MDKHPTNNGTPVSIPSPVFPLLRPVDDDDFDVSQILGQFLSVVRRRVWLILGVATVSMVGITVSTPPQEPVYSENFRLLVEPVNSIGGVSGLNSSISEDLNGSQGNVDYESLIEILRSPKLLQQVVQPLQTEYPSLNYNQLVNNLRITKLQNTKILEISYVSGDPDQIEAVLQQLVTVYLEYSLIDRQASFKHGIQFIDQQLPKLQQQVDNLQNELQKFRQDYNFTDPDTQFTQISQKAAALEQERLQLQQEIVQAQNNVQSLQGESGMLAALKDAPSYQQLIGQIRSVDASIARESTRFQQDSLNIQVLEEERQNLLPILQQEAERVRATQLADAMTQLQSLQAGIPSLNQAQAEIEQSFQDLAVLSRRYVDLQRKLQISTDALTKLLADRQTLEVQAARTETPWELIDEVPTRPTSPISPSSERRLVQAIIVSLFLSLGAAFLLDQLTGVYYSTDDLKNRTKLPLLGNIPYQKQYGMMEEEEVLPPMIRLKHWLNSLSASAPIKTLRKIMGAKETYEHYGYYGGSAFSESLRVLQTNIKLLSADRPLRSIIITSASPADGKSTIAMNLAQTAAIFGQKTLLVDCDMRRPQIAQRLNLRQDDGLSNALTSNSSGIKVKEHFQKPIPFIDFSVLSSGNIPPDPTKLLASQKMQHLVENFEQMFDLVVYDTPPLLGLADATLLASHADGVILVVTLNKTGRSDLSQAIATLKQSKIPILGIVANNQTTGTYDYSSYSYYGYQQKNNNHNGSDLSYSNNNSKVH